jgi:hypothetical protein
VGADEERGEEGEGDGAVRGKFKAQSSRFKVQGSRFKVEVGEVGWAGRSKIKRRMKIRKMIKSRSKSKIRIGIGIGAAWRA